MNTLVAGAKMAEIAEKYKIVEKLKIAKSNITWKSTVLYSSIPLVVGICLRFTMAPLYDFNVNQHLNLKRGTTIRNQYLNGDYQMSLCVHFFNVSNPSGVQSGNMPILKDIGPYCYKMESKKVNIIENDADDTMQYTIHNRYFFDTNRSYPLREDDSVTILHPLIVGLIDFAAANSVALIPIFTKAINSIFRQPESIYLTVKVRDALFDGIEIDCEVDDTFGKGLCAQAKIQYPDVKQVRKNIYSVSIFGPENDTNRDTLKVLRGVVDHENLGRLLEHNDKHKLSIWSNSICNHFGGTDGWIFPPFRPEDEVLKYYVPQLCRDLFLKYVQDVDLNGIPARKYEESLGDPVENPEDKCYCVTSKTCTGRNSMNLQKCLKMPMIVSYPHFFDGDRNYVENLIGIEPDEEKHSSYMYFQSDRAKILKSRRRLQYSFFLRSYNTVPFMKSVPKVLHPVFWQELALDLNEDQYEEIRDSFSTVQSMKIVPYILSSFGILGLGTGGYMYYKEKNPNTSKPQPAKSVPVEAAKSNGNSISGTPQNDVEVTDLN